MLLVELISLPLIIILPKPPPLLVILAQINDPDPLVTRACPLVPPPMYILDKSPKLVVPVTVKLPAPKTPVYVGKKAATLLSPYASGFVTV